LCYNTTEKGIIRYVLR